MSRPALAFGVITLLPVLLLVLGAGLGGVWPWIALAYLTIVAMTLDRLVALAAPRNDKRVEFPAADALSVTLALAHFAILALVIFRLGRAPFAATGTNLALFVAAGLFFGQVGNSNAHELIHRTSRGLYGLGVAVYVSLLFGHHASAHRHVHHRFVASPADPNSARRGEGFYRFALRAWIGSFRAGWRAESKLRERHAHGLHPYAVYLGGAGLTLVLAVAIGGIGGALVLIGLAGHAQMQLLLSDYVQHYGLRRARLGDGRLEPVNAGQSWNAPHWFSGHLMLNAPRHSDHHAHPSRRFPDLTLPAADSAPTLPHSLPVMSTLALIPPIWRRVMDRRVADWHARAQTARAA